MSEPPRFAPRSHPGTEPSDPEATRRQRLDATLAEISVCLDDAARLVALGRARFDDDWMAERAARNILTELAETVARLPEAFRQADPEVPWRAMAGMRNRIVHAYQTVDRELVWNALAVDLPALQTSLHRG